jgi:hypothetical protein
MSTRRREAAKKTAAHHNLSRFLVRFEVNDIVIVHNGDRVAKLAARWSDPMRVKAIIRDGTYEVEPVAVSQQPRRLSKRRVVHVSRMRRYSSAQRDMLLSRTSKTMTNVDEDKHPGSVVEADTFTVQAILGCTTLDSGQVKYRVRWEGYEEVTEEPFDNLKDCVVFQRWLEVEIKKKDQVKEKVPSKKKPEVVKRRTSARRRSQNKNQQ